jgi:hypothetical protein
MPNLEARGLGSKLQTYTVKFQTKRRNWIPQVCRTLLNVQRSSPNVNSKQELGVALVFVHMDYSNPLSIFSNPKLIDRLLMLLESPQSAKLLHFLPASMIQGDSTRFCPPIVDLALLDCPAVTRKFSFVFFNNNVESAMRAEHAASARRVRR